MTMTNPSPRSTTSKSAANDTALDVYAHVEASVRAVLEDSDDARIQWLLQPRWIGYTKAQQALERLERLLHQPPTQRMPNLLLIGETNNGKSTISHHFADRYPPDDHPEGEAVRYPVMVIQTPQVPAEHRLYEELLDAVYAPYRPGHSVSQKLRQVRTIFRHLHVRLLILDELHHILAGRVAQQRVFLNTLKFLGNDLQMPIVGVGTVDALRAVQTDPQLANRFQVFTLPKWTLDHEFRKLLASFERVLPLRRPSHLHRKALAADLLALSEGTIGDLASVLNLAAEAAIRTGREQIDRAVLRELDWDPPSTRRRRANERPG
jgi:Bacterial TniB protein